MRSIITVEQFGLTAEYLKWEDEVKKEICFKIVTQAFAKMVVPATKEQRVSTIKDILSRSIHHYEDLEEYEKCQILSDIRNALELI